ncbi:PREDICTED: putative late blight resistance protein homolog R1B-12 isoform X2 [Ipomoea nil]|uniref:putative late blight resistance protein homolog R1B-12 isoform X2 n=1 Tax=Ipomoea nil TaxID=35883 RepID=UPI000900C8F3|nr:PREDICTED: putative late blight resistance protein homolog R1B-12 isoform X2 [Ipomoea nil]
MACVAVNSLITTLELEFLQPQPRPILQQMELIPFNKDLIQSLHGKLGFLIQLFDKSRMDGVEAIKELETKLRDVAFRVEDEIELHVVDLYKEADEEMGQGDTEAKKTQHCHRLSHVLQQAIEDIYAIKEELEKVMMEYKHVIAVQGRETTLVDDVVSKSDDELVKTDGSGSSNRASHTEDIMVGKNNEFDIIMKMLIQHSSKQREVVSIQGMGGIGKTTLARQVYENPSTVSHFDRRLWVVVSQHHNKRQMLLGLLGSNVNNSSDGDLALRLYQSLKGQRYLVVMDDVWSKESWNDVNSCFPDDKNGSRVLLTTRIAEVATCIGSKSYFSHQMHLLDQSESWELFHKKACKSHGVEFETIGRPIVEKCKGLPLAIVVVVGLFSKLNTLDEWKNTANALISSSTSTLDDGECWRILSLSYSHLPHNLKACFLYLGVFPEDYKINANNLARLWAAEGFVKAFNNESFEVAKRYINELMDRNLILVSKRSSCGRKIKEFRVHDLLHAFCVKESQNQSLLHVAYESGSNFPEKGVRWIRMERVSFEDFDISALHSLSKHCWSIFYFPEWRKHSIILEFFNLLRVLYVTDEFQSPSPTVHIHLRYLWILKAGRRRQSPYDSLFSNAWNLQTYSAYEDIKLNHLNFPQLQYIHCDAFSGAFPNSVHQNLQAINRFPDSHCNQEFLTIVPYLKKVTIHMSRIDDSTKNLVCLEQLESLSIRVYIFWLGIEDMMAPIVNNILLLRNIRKLRFDFMHSEWKVINNVLSKLQTLEVLKFRASNLGEKWEVPENEKFSNLISLEISRGNLMHWEVGADSFPKLERLFLNRCLELREIPNSFADIQTLNFIQLDWCSTSIVMSAKKIQADQRDYGKENMVVILNSIPVDFGDDSDEGEFEEDDSDGGELDEDDSDEGELDEDEE